MPLVASDEIRAEPVVAAHRYWRSKIRGDRLPSRRDIDPSEIPGLLPFVILSEVLQGPLLIRYRLVGTTVVQMNGFNFTGGGIAESVSDPVWRTYWEDKYRWVVEQHQSLFGADRYSYRQRDFVSFEWCILPLASDGETVDMCFEIEAPAQPVRRQP